MTNGVRIAAIFNTGAVMACQALFNRVVSSCLPEAVPIQLDQVDKFDIGKVLILSCKPRRFSPRYKKDLKLTGCSLSSLLKEPDAKEMNISTGCRFLFDESKGCINLTVSLAKDPELQKMLGELVPTVSSEGTKQVTVHCDFCRVSHVSTDLLHSVTTKKIHVQMDHPVIQEAVANGRTLFVVTTIFNAEKCKIMLSTDSASTSSEGNGFKFFSYLSNSGHSVSLCSQECFSCTVQPVIYAIQKFMFQRYANCYLYIFQKFPRNRLKIM